jgi:YHS domain-containing protein
MKKEKIESVKCQYCNTEISAEPCELAAYSTVIDGKKYAFCCKTCAKEYEQDKAK